MRLVGIALVLATAVVLAGCGGTTKVEAPNWT